jgi:hypothetical protein
MTTPADVTGLRLWLKADAITGLSDGAAVATWPDSSGLGNDAGEGTGTFQPTYQTNEVNGLPCVRFDGTDDRLSIPGTNMLAASNNAAGLTAFAYVNLSSPSNASRDIYSISNGTDATATRIKFGQRAVTLGEWSLSGRRLDADTAQNLVGNQTQTGWQLYTVVSDWANASAFIYRNENLETSTTSWLTAGNTSATNALACRVGVAPSGGSEYWIGDIAEIAVYDNAVSTADRQALWTYFQAKYAPPAGTPLLNPTFLIRRGLWRPVLASAEPSAAVADQPLVATGIFGAEAVGAATVAPGDVTITATGIAGGEAVGSLALTQTVAAASISSAEAVGAAATGQGLVATGITTAERPGQSVVTPGTVTITATGISGAEQVGAVAVGLNLAATGIGTGEASGQSQLGQGLVAAGISTGERDGQATVTPGAVTIAPTGINTGEQSGSSTLNLNLAAAGIPTGQASGQVQLGQGVVAAGISTGERSGAAVVTPGTATVAPAGIGSLEQSGASTVTPGPVSLAAVGISSLAAMGNAAAAMGLLAAGIASVERSGQPILTITAPPEQVNATSTTTLTAQNISVSAVSAQRTSATTATGQNPATTVTGGRTTASTVTSGRSSTPSVSDG